METLEADMRQIRDVLPIQDVPPDYRIRQNAILSNVSGHLLLQTLEQMVGTEALDAALARAAADIRMPPEEEVRYSPELLLGTVAHVIRPFLPPTPEHVSDAALQQNTHALAR